MNGSAVAARPGSSASWKPATPTEMSAQPGTPKRQSGVPTRSSTPNSPPKYNASPATSKTNHAPTKCSGSVVTSAAGPQQQVPIPGHQRTHRGTEQPNQTDQTHRVRVAQLRELPNMGAAVFGETQPGPVGHGHSPLKSDEPFPIDRSSQYTSNTIARMCRVYCLSYSVGSTGVWWDNAAAESLLGTLRKELINRNYYQIRHQARLSIRDWDSGLAQAFPVSLQYRESATQRIGGRPLPTDSRITKCPAQGGTSA